VHLLGRTSAAADVDLFSQNLSAGGRPHHKATTCAARNLRHPLVSHAGDICDFGLKPVHCGDLISFRKVPFIGGGDCPLVR
jgi:hypothetical protein